MFIPGTRTTQQQATLTRGMHLRSRPGDPCASAAACRRRWRPRWRPRCQPAAVCPASLAATSRCYHVFFFFFVGVDFVARGFSPATTASQSSPSSQS